MTAEGDTESSKPFLMCVEVDRTCHWIINIYSQYWIINKTGLPLSIGVSFVN